MTADELRDKFTKATRIATREKAMRKSVFANDPKKQAAKMAEMDELIAILVEMKDELKALLPPDFEQQPLIDVPKPAQYH